MGVSQSSMGVSPVIASIHSVDFHNISRAHPKSAEKLLARDESFMVHPADKVLPPVMCTLVNIIIGKR